MLKKLFQYAVLLNPTRKEEEDGTKDVEIVIPPSGWILASSEQEVVMVATRKITGDMMKYADRLEVAVRPF